MVNGGLLASSTPVVVEVKEPSYEHMIKVLAVENDVDPELALAISKCESELRQFNTDGTVLRGEENPADVGLFQINEFYHLKDSKELGLDIYTPTGNIKYAMHILKKDGPAPWVYSKPCWGSKIGRQVALAK